MRGRIRDWVVYSLLGTGLVASPGCALIRPVPLMADPSRPAYSSLRSGQFVRLHLQDGQRVEFVVDRIEPDAIVAVDGRRYANDVITRAEVRRLTKGEVAVISVLVGAAVLLYLYVQALGSAIDETWW